MLTLKDCYDLGYDKGYGLFPVRPYPEVLRFDTDKLAYKAGWADGQWDITHHAAYRTSRENPGDP